MISLESDVFLSILPWVTYSTTEVRNIPIRKRGLGGCVFPDEVDLHKMKHYSYNNCITECRENYTLEICGCTQFYYPNNGRTLIKLYSESIITMTPSGIDPATFRFVARCLNHCATSCPQADNVYGEKEEPSAH
jgi:hypothetical protein